MNKSLLLPHLGGQLLLSIHQALDVGRVVATALTGCDGALEGGAGNLRRDAGGGAEGPAAHAGGQRLAQGLVGRRLCQLLAEQEQVTRLLHLQDEARGRGEEKAKETWKRGCE